MLLHTHTVRIKYTCTCRSACQAELHHMCERVANKQEFTTLKIGNIYFTFAIQCAMRRAYGLGRVCGQLPFLLSIVSGECVEQCVLQ